MSAMIGNRGPIVSFPWNAGAYVNCVSKGLLRLEGLCLSQFERGPKTGILHFQCPTGLWCTPVSMRRTNMPLKAGEVGIKVLLRVD